MAMLKRGLQFELFQLHLFFWLAEFFNLNLCKFYLFFVTTIIITITIDTDTNLDIIINKAFIISLAPPWSPLYSWPCYSGRWQLSKPCRLFCCPGQAGYFIYIALDENSSVLLNDRDFQSCSIMNEGHSRQSWLWLLSASCFALKWPVKTPAGWQIWHFYRMQKANKSPSPFVKLCVIFSGSTFDE